MTWAHVARNRRNRVQVDERGKTNDIIAEIRENARLIPNIGVWANPGHKEIDHGSDMDIFVETKLGVFVWWALQAKVLKVDGTYKDLKKEPGGSTQWSKLNQLSIKAGCLTRYLLYNGLGDFPYEGVDLCNRGFNEEQYGCSLVTTEDMEQIANAKVPRFWDFHPDHAQPWRIITCCKISTQRADLTYYTAGQIKRALDYYPEKPNNAGKLLPEGEDSLSLNDRSLDAINAYSADGEWRPDYRVVVRTTEWLNS